MKHPVRFKQLSTGDSVYEICGLGFTERKISGWSEVDDKFRTVMDDGNVLCISKHTFSQSRKGTLRVFYSDKSMAFQEYRSRVYKALSKSSYNLQVLEIAHEKELDNLNRLKCLYDSLPYDVDDVDE